MPFPVDIKWVNQTESKLGVKFPSAFVTAMVSMNGGSVRMSTDQFELFPFFDGTDKKHIQRTCNSIDRETSYARKNSHGFPENAVAIGANGCGDLLMLLPMDDTPEVLQHNVYWWDHETATINDAADDFGDLDKS
jgi:hypothetical protein